MTAPLDFRALTPRQRADTILTAARTELSGRLWRAALGEADRAEARERWVPPAIGGVRTPTGPTHLDALLAAASDSLLEIAPPVSVSDAAPLASAEDIGTDVAPAAGLGPNARHAPALEAASARTGMPAAALAAIIDAEAGRSANGGWNPYSRNPRSSAAGLGQFLSGTWIDMARQDGSWLNAEARRRGWLDANGRVAEGARAPLLSLRYDPSASIHAVADYARGNVAALRAHGVPVGEDAASLSRAAYIGHHLGPGDALRYYRGAIPPDRARHLLAAQIGADAARQRIAQAGDATQAHREWLAGHVGRHVRADRYLASG